MIRKLGCWLAIAVLTALTPQAADAGFQFSFTNITHTNATNAAAGETQLKVEALDAGAGQVLFRFTNSGYAPAAMSITDVYFDDTTPAYFQTTIAAIQNGTGVGFTAPATPLNLPGGGAVTFDSNISADSLSPIVANGVNPGETLGILLTLKGGKTFSNVVSGLQSAYLRIGIHVQGFANGGSESFINTTTPRIVPEPSSLMLASTALVGLFLGRRRMTNRA